MPEQSFCYSTGRVWSPGQDEGPMEVWFLLMKLLECQEPWTVLPSKLHADARVLVERGIVLEDLERPGAFRVNPEIAYVSSEPTISEVLREGDS